MGKQRLLRSLRWLLGFFQAAWKTPFLFLFLNSFTYLGFPGSTSGKEPACQCRRHKRYSFNSCVGKIPRRRKCQPTPVFLFGESHEQRSLAGYSPQGRKELVMTEVTLHGNTHLPSALFFKVQKKKAIFVPRERTQTSPFGHLNTCSWTSFNCHWVWAINMLLELYVCFLQE